MQDDVFQDLGEAEKRSVVRDIDVFLNSMAGQTFKRWIKHEFDERVEYLLDQPIDEKYTPFTREGYIGECRQLKANITHMEQLRDMFVNELKETETQTNTEND